MTTTTRSPRAATRPTPGISGGLLLLTRVLAGTHLALVVAAAGFGLLMVADDLASSSDMFDGLGLAIGVLLLVYASAVGTAALIALRASGPFLPHGAAAVASLLPVTAAVQQGSVEGGTAGLAYVALCAVTLVVATAGLAVAATRR